MTEPYDAIILVSFGGPDRADDVLPFLENVTRGRNIPPQRLEQVAQHYFQLGGASPINAQNQALIAALVAELNEHGPSLPVYWGNRNWHPLLSDTLRQMSEDGVHHALAFFTSPYSSYSSCRQYREDIERALTEVGRDAPKIDKLRAYFNHPGFIEAMAARVQAALDEISTENRTSTIVVFTAHSIPMTMAENCQYEVQLREASRLVAGQLGVESWQLVYQSRSGPPNQPWLEPDVCDVLNEVGRSGTTTGIVVAPIGFISDHMEVAFDLDVEAREVCERHQLNMVRAGTVGTHPSFVSMIRELIAERVENKSERPALGELGTPHDFCPVDCCQYQPHRPGHVKSP